MRSSNKSRSRNKNSNRRNTSGNQANRVYDSSGPDGRVRGTPQQIVEKYNNLARDAHLMGDRVSAESFNQFAEHYLRLLNEAQREAAERQAEHQKRQAQQQSAKKEHKPQPEQPPRSDPSVEEQPPMAAMPVKNNDLVETPESKAPTTRRPRTSKPAPVQEAPVSD